MRSVISAASCLTLAGCSAPVMFSVAVDEDIDHGTLTLNGNTGKLMRNMDGNYWAKWSGSDASGHIEVVFSDGETTRCEVGYVTHGLLEVQEFVVENRKCRKTDRPLNEQ